MPTTNDDLEQDLEDAVRMSADPVDEDDLPEWWVIQP